MIRELGEDYTRTLRNSWPEVPGGVDLVCYWFAKAWAMLAAGRLHRAGLVSTNSIRGGVNREVLKPIVDGGRIRSEEHTYELQSLMRTSYAVFCLKQKIITI